MMKPPPEGTEERDAPPSQGPVRKFARFLRHNRRYWLAPAIIMIILIGLLMLIAGSSVAPFTYPDS